MDGFSSDIHFTLVLFVLACNGVGDKISIITVTENNLNSSSRDKDIVSMHERRLT